MDMTRSATTIVPIQDAMARAFPAMIHRRVLSVATTKDVYTWSLRGAVCVFKSQFEGIVTAKRTAAKEDLIAVADGQVVFLHDIKTGTRSSHRFLEEEKVGFISKLHFDRRTQQLYFTTSLQYAVQSFSLQNHALLDPAAIHATPLTTFAVSSTLDLIFSASANPPVLMLSGVDARSRCLLLQPRCSTSAVVAAAFHPQQGTLLGLAFEDGTLAVYDTSSFTKLSKSNAPTSSTMAEGEIGHIKNMHITGVRIDPTLQESSRLRGRSLHRGVIDVSFLPEPGATIVSVASDGKCCIVCFESSLGKHPPKILRQWSVPTSATALSIDKWPDERRQSRSSTDIDCKGNGRVDLRIAIGCFDGRVQIYDFLGKLLAERIFGSPEPVSDLEWIDYRSDLLVAEESLHTRSESTTSHQRLKGALPPEIGKLSSGEEKIGNNDLNCPTLVHISASPAMFSNSQGLEPTSHVLEMRSPLIGDFHLDHASGEPHTTADNAQICAAMGTGGTITKGSVSTKTPRKTERSTSYRRVSNRQPPRIPPRPTPREGGKLAQRRLERVAPSKEVMNHCSRPYVGDIRQEELLLNVAKSKEQRTLPKAKTPYETTPASKNFARMQSSPRLKTPALETEQYSFGDGVNQEVPRPEAKGSTWMSQSSISIASSSDTILDWAQHRQTSSPMKTRTKEPDRGHILMKSHDQAIEQKSNAVESRLRRVSSTSSLITRSAASTIEWSAQNKPYPYQNEKVNLGKKPLSSLQGEAGKQIAEDLQGEPAIKKQAEKKSKPKTFFPFTPSAAPLRRSSIGKSKKVFEIANSNPLPKDSGGEQIHQEIMNMRSDIFTAFENLKEWIEKLWDERDARIVELVEENAKLRQQSDRHRP